VADPFERDTCPRSQLSLGRQPLGKGAVGAVYALNDDPRWVYKEYSEDTLADARFDASALQRAITWRRELRHQEREQVSQTLCWPRTAITRGKRIIGVILPRIPPRFAVAVDGQTTLRTLDHLFLHPKRLVPLGLTPFPHVVRTALLYGLARAMALTERHGIAHGDISAANVLYAYESERPSIYLIDCDSVAVGGRGAFAVRGTPYWQDPRVANGSIEEPDVDSDRHALGLAFYRIWNRTPGNINSQSRLTLTPPATAELAQLLRGALQPATPRPAAASWASALGDYLRQHAGTAGPTLAEAVERLSRDHQLITHIDLGAIDESAAFEPPSPEVSFPPSVPPSSSVPRRVPSEPTALSTAPPPPSTLDLCPACSAPVGRGHRFCRRCGRPVSSTSPATSPPPRAAVSQARTCGRCGAHVGGDHEFCRRCGNRLNAP
jgi:hypothetical protein